MRQVLQLEQDVQEIDSWGLDCYTRKNIQDGMASHLLAAAGRWYLACHDGRPLLVKHVKDAAACV